MQGLLSEYGIFVQDDSSLILGSQEFETALSLHLAMMLSGQMFFADSTALSGQAFWDAFFVVFVVFHQTLFPPPLRLVFCQLSLRSFVQLFFLPLSQRLSDGHESISDHARTFVFVAIPTSAFVKKFRPLARMIHRLIHQG